MNLNTKSLSIFFPCYNDAGTIEKMVTDSFQTLKELNIQDGEVIVVDDASRDNSLKILKNLQKQYPGLNIIEHKKNTGYGGALIAGFNNSKNDLIFYTDGDAQYDPKELKLLYQKYLETNADIVNGYKIKRHDPIHRIIIGSIYNFVVKTMFGIKLKDVDCDFRLIKKDVIKKINLTQTSGVICVELVKKFEKAGFKTAQVPVHHYIRTYGKSQFFNFKRIFKVGIDLIKLWFTLVIYDKLKGSRKGSR